MTRHFIHRWAFVSLSLALAFAAAVLLGLSGCSASGGGDAKGAGAQGGAAIAFTDTAGHEVSLSGPASRVVAVDAASCETVYAIGAQDLLVARGAYCDYPEEALALPAVDSGAQMNVEQILSLDPDLVITTTMNQSIDQVYQLEDAGVAVMVNATADIEGVYADIANLGVALGKTTEAERLVADMRQSFAALVDEAEAQSACGTQSVYFEVSPLEAGLWTAGEGTFMDEIAEMLGIHNAFHDVEGWAEISEEQVISRAPSLIVSTFAADDSSEGSPSMGSVDEIASRTGWDSIPAIRDGRVAALQDDSLTVPGPRLVDGARWLYAFAYGVDEGA